MKIAKDRVLQLLAELRAAGHHPDIALAQRDLPDPVDTDEHGGLLAQLGVSAWDLEHRLGGHP